MFYIFVFNHQVIVREKKHHDLNFYDTLPEINWNWEVYAYEGQKKIPNKFNILALFLNINKNKYILFECLLLNLILCKQRAIIF